MPRSTKNTKVLENRRRLCRDILRRGLNIPTNEALQFYFTGKMKKPRGRADSTDISEQLSVKYSEQAIMVLTSHCDSQRERIMVATSHPNDRNGSTSERT
ncbi:hypothetical protein PoB_004523600 [Plakobranchus ocellatus]|uniref:Uncharacterized protein n=1 Tax=Plakobranchus ocellatus TaxID=259542 RepID=A0AAV4B5R4_9GAST|nr:hypothetical protein PoB_004523600 [Plakobranchus ocellatus]